MVRRGTFVCERYRCGAHATQNERREWLSRGTSMRILIVDDHPIVASGCRAVLADEGEIDILEAEIGRAHV